MLVGMAVLGAGLEEMGVWVGRVGKVGTGVGWVGKVGQKVGQAGTVAMVVVRVGPEASPGAALVALQAQGRRGCKGTLCVSQMLVCLAT